MSFQFRENHGVPFYCSDLLVGGIVHGFSTRLGGVSGGMYESLNLRQYGPEPDPLVLENYRRFCGAVGADFEGLVLSAQVHEDTVRHVTAADRGKGIITPAGYTADALVTNEPGLNLTVFSADCIILLFWDPVAGAAGACHAGWRGTALDLPVKTVTEMARLFRARPEDIHVAVGAGIGMCCFETGDDVPDAMRTAFGSGADAFIRSNGCGKWFVDLKGINVWRLLKSGVKEAHIDVCPLCTACNPGLFWSHRKCGERRGLQCGLIGLTGRGSRL
ncbi:MAG: polyphenol oxidase family protein [Oscillospiraceae bacterium]|nr:polyphenol oxidase family protein [Oscillospiraceae bacterium]